MHATQRTPATRRQFLQHAAALAGSLPASWIASGPARGDEPARPAGLPIIDTHQHLWDLNKFRLAWVAGRAELNRSFVTADYLQATAGLNVAQAVYMEVDVAPEQQREEAEYVIGLCRSPEHPTAAAVISGRPAEDGFADYITAYRDSPYIKGVRQVLHAGSAPPGLCLEERFVRSMRLLGRLGMCFDLCMRSAELADGARLAELCPETRLVLDHCGNPDPGDFAAAAGEQQRRRAEQWRRDLVRVAARPNVVCKISGIVARLQPGRWTAQDLAPVVNHCLDQFGPERVMFASDWPVCTLAASFSQWVAALKEIVAPRSRQDQQQLFYGNAARFYGLT